VRAVGSVASHHDATTYQPTPTKATRCAAGGLGAGDDLEATAPRSRHRTVQGVIRYFLLEIHMNNADLPQPNGYRVVLELPGFEELVIPHHVRTAMAVESFLARMAAALQDCLSGLAALGRTPLELYIARDSDDTLVLIQVQPGNGRGGSVWLSVTEGAWEQLPNHPEVAAGVICARLDGLPMGSAEKRRRLSTSRACSANADGAGT
jgi:hypothetical protein